MIISSISHNTLYHLIKVTIIYIVASTLQFSGAQKKYFMKYLCTKHNVMQYIVFYFINFNKPLKLTSHGIYF
jgi:hypothetical protein